MFNGGFKEATEQSATMEEDNAQNFGLLINWIYNNKLGLGPDWNLSSQTPIEHTTAVSDVLNFYLLSEKLCLSELTDSIVQILPARHGHSRKCPLLT
jgi:hypothetical protein